MALQVAPRNQGVKSGQGGFSRKARIPPTEPRRAAPQGRPAARANARNRAKGPQQEPGAARKRDRAPEPMRGAKARSAAESKYRRFCCPVRLRTAGIRFCYRVRPEPCSSLITKAVRPTGYAAIANASLSLAFVGFEQFYGLLSPGKNTVVPHTSILVRPRQSRPRCAKRPGRFWWSRRVLPPGPL